MVTQGIIINGCVRDTEDVSKVPVGVKALSVCPIKPGKAPTGQRGQSVTFAGITFNEGDWIYADAGRPPITVIVDTWVGTAVRYSGLAAPALTSTSNRAMYKGDHCHFVCPVKAIQMGRCGSSSATWHCRALTLHTALA